MADQPSPTREVQTYSNRGQWVTRVVDEPEMSRSFSSREEAVEAGDRLAERLGTAHRVIQSEPEGTITDQDEPSTDATPPRASLGAQSDLPPTTDDDGMPVENPSG